MMAMVHLNQTQQIMAMDYDAKSAGVLGVPTKRNVCPYCVDKRNLVGATDTDSRFQQLSAHAQHHV